MPQLYVLAPVEFNSAAPTCDCVAHWVGNAADHRERVRRYPSDMTDAEWAVVRPLLQARRPGWRAGVASRRRTVTGRGNQVTGAALVSDNDAC
ncbi:hypothetical protein TUSST3_29810 [Streptomyces sp. TUS-ST3]|nr:hypothetical protein TUSST3_29810 [Streptomyces sp. TUS-ST3]